MKNNLPYVMQEAVLLTDGYKTQKKTLYSDYPYHYHDHYELEFVVSGVYEHEINGKTVEARRGYAYLLRPTDMHEIKANGEYVIYSTLFLSDFAEGKTFSAFIKRNSSAFAFFNGKDADFIEELFVRLTETKDKEVAKSLFTVILSLLLSNSVKDEEDEEEDKIFNAIKYINENFTDSPTLKKVAEYCGYQENYFCRKFKSVTGTTFSDYLIDLKIQFATRLLSSDTMPSALETCYACGFNSLSSFMREFKKRTGY
ncbi:MAG: AraC family transcriptional regulator, partial [Clostridia bacterium]|nr:AraC family transcriptional regulator [Clostridia bacterium]